MPNLIRFLLDLGGETLLVFKNMYPILPNHTLIAARTNPTTSKNSLWNVWKSTASTSPSGSSVYSCSDGSDKEKRNLKKNIYELKNREVKNRGCFAVGRLAKDVKSNEIDDLTFCIPPAETAQISISSKQNVLQANDKTTANVWIKCVQFSNDVHSNNSILELSPACKQPYLRILRTIESGEELTMWFSEEIIALMYIPFLSPANIRDKNCYICNMCHKVYENPNPLKIHMATNCERNTQQILWQRLELSIPRANNMFSLPTPLPTEPPKFPQYQPRLSAFQPVLPLNYSLEKAHRHPSPTSIFEHTMKNQHFSNIINPLQANQSGDHSSDQVATAAAHLETIVSNMGTSKQGHLCIYCGKLYSRKYGLKIHIRTHTGFKPLKCKYCLRPFGDPSNLNKHVRLHVQGNTVYKCTDCDKILVRRRDLQRHILARHHPQRHQIRQNEGDFEDMDTTIDVISIKDELVSSGSSGSNCSSDHESMSSDEDDFKRKNQNLIQ